MSRTPPTVRMGSYTMVTADDTAGTVSIPSGLTVFKYFNVTIVDSGGNVVTSDADLTISGSNLVVADGGSFANTAGYVVYFTTGN